MHSHHLSCCDCSLLFGTIEQKKRNHHILKCDQETTVTTSFLLVSAVSYHRVGIRFPSCKKQRYFSGLGENSFYFIICLKLFFCNLCLGLSWQLIVGVSKGVLAHQGAHLLSLSDLEKTVVETSRMLHV